MSPPAPVLALLTLIYLLNYLDRQIVVILQEPIKADYKLEDWQLGLLTGASIGLFYTAMGIPIARLIDRGAHRVRLIAMLIAVWSLLTALCGVTRSFAQFIVVRMGVGLAEAGFAPAAHSLLSDLYPVRKRPTAMGIFAAGIPLGVMCGLSIGGYIAQHYNWRIALLVVGLPGLLVAGLFRLIAHEPQRGASEEEAIGAIEPMPFGDAARLLARRAGFVHVVLGSAATSFALMGIASWLPSFLIRAQGMNLAEAGFGVGALSGATGLLGTSFGGWQASRLSGRGLHAILWLPILGILLSIPLYLLGFLASTATMTLWLLLPPMILTAFWTAPSIALVQSLAPIPARATASAIYIVGSNVIGVALGPLVIGALSDLFAAHLGDAATGLRWALICAALSLLWAAAHWILAARALHRAGAPAATPGAVARAA